MSRWIELFESHDFRKQWSTVVDLTEHIDLDKFTATTEIEELARLKKVVAYLESLLGSLDPELVPESTWDSSKLKAQNCAQNISDFLDDANISRVASANKHLDGLLSVLVPFHTDCGDVAKAAIEGFAQYSKTVSSQLTNFLDLANKNLEVIADEEKRAQQFVTTSEKAASRIKDLESSYFDDTESESLKTRLAALESEINTNAKNIEKYKGELLGEDGSSDESISSRITLYESEAKHDAEQIALAAYSAQNGQLFRN